MNLGKVILTASGAVGLTAALAYAAPVFTAFFQATGQTTSYQADKNDGIVGPVAVPDDGALRRGNRLRYKLKADGTIKDRNTGLIWEVKCSACGGLHEVSNEYVWSEDGTQETIWDWLDDINAEGGPGYAGHNDWRIPNERELQSLVDFGRSAPAIDAIFSPTSPSAYWSSTTDAGDASAAWFVHFVGGGTDIFDKSANSLFVRAVRGGAE